MTRRPHAPILVPFVAVLLTMSTSVRGQDSLASARQLYASAEYQGALTILNHLLAGSPSQQERQSIELYRTFCLVAIGCLPQASMS